MEQSIDKIGLSFGRVFGSVLTAGSQIGAGKKARKAAEADALQYEQRANEEEAISQRAAEERRYESVLLQSRALAVAAASGAGASDPTIVNAIARIAGRGDLAARGELYRGKTTGNRYRYAAAARRYEGKDAERAGTVGAAATMFKGAVSLYDRYGDGGPVKVQNPQAETARDLEYDDWWTE